MQHLIKTAKSFYIPPRKLASKVTFELFSKCQYKISAPFQKSLATVSQTKMVGTFTTGPLIPQQLRLNQPICGFTQPLHSLESSSHALVSWKLLHWAGICWVRGPLPQPRHTSRTSSQAAPLNKHPAVRKMRTEKSSSIPSKPFWSGCVASMNCPLMGCSLHKE